MTSSELAGVVLAAGHGRRLHPLTMHRPKALCPVGNIALVDHAINRLHTVTKSVAVNVHAGRAAMVEHLTGRVHLSVEEPVALGTAGAIGALRSWIDGRGVVVTNADAWIQLEAPGSGETTGLEPVVAKQMESVDLGLITAGWDGERVRVLCVSSKTQSDFGHFRFAGVSLMPWRLVKDLAVEPAGLYEVVWRQEFSAGRLEVITWDGAFIDCGTIADYLAANMSWSGGRSVLAPNIKLSGRLNRCVLWPGASTYQSEFLSESIRGPGWTVLSR